MAAAAACGSPTSTSSVAGTPGSAVASATTSGPDATATAGSASTVTPAASPPTSTLARGTLTLTDLSRLSLNLVSPSYSPDGSKILGGGADGLEVGAADGTGLRAIVADATSADWSPDSSRIAVTVVRGGLTDPRQTADVVVMNADGSSPVTVGQSDFPAYVQYLSDGRVAYVSSQRLRFFDPATGTDTEQSRANLIINDDSAPTVPFLVSDDGRFAATMRGIQLAVQDLATGDARQLTDGIDGRQWSGYGWSPAGALAYADTDSRRIPAIHLYDPAASSERLLVQGTEPGVFSGVEWISPDWLIYVFYPAGTVAEELAEYRAMNAATGTDTVLFKRGMAFSLTGGGRKLTFTRSATATEPFQYWVATLSLE